MDLIIGNPPKHFVDGIMKLVGESAPALISADDPIRIEIRGENAYVTYTKVRVAGTSDVFAVLGGDGE